VPARVREEVPDADVGPDAGLRLEGEQRQRERRREGLRDRGDPEDGVRRAPGGGDVTTSVDRHADDGGRHLPALRGGFQRPRKRRIQHEFATLLPGLAPAPRVLPVRGPAGAAVPNHEEVRMALTKEAQYGATQKFGKHETDTGSPEVQIAMH